MFNGFSDREIASEKALIKVYKKALKQNPFTTTGLTQEKEQELLDDDSSDEISVSSEEPSEPPSSPISIDSSSSLPRRSPGILIGVKTERTSPELTNPTIHFLKLNSGTRVTTLGTDEMFLIQTASGLNVLYVGPSTRPSARTEEEPTFWNGDVHVLYVNTTYLSRKFSFRDQWPVVTDICEFLRGNFPPIASSLLLVGGQVSRKRLANYSGIANIHVLDDLHYDHLLHYLDNLPTTYGFVLVVRPHPAATNRRSPPRVAKKCPDCSVDDDDGTRRFVRFLRPLEIVSTGDTHLRSDSAVSVGDWPEVAPGTLSVTSFVRRMGECCAFCDKLNRSGGEGL